MRFSDSKKQVLLTRKVSRRLVFDSYSGVGWDLSETFTFPETLFDFLTRGGF